MYRFIRWYNQNRTRFYIILSMIIFGILIIQILNSIAEKQLEERKKNMGNIDSSTNQSTTISEPRESVFTKEKIKTYDSNINLNLVKRFVDYCNNNEIELAYNMISDECRESIFPTLELFKINYYDRIFYIYRLYNLENWFTDIDSFTYYIKYTEDVLATGNVNSLDTKGDYITVVKKQGEYKLNINSYIGREINLMSTKNSYSIQANINYIDKYMDYCIVNVSVKNNTQNTICIDTKENSESMYIYDENKVKYTSFLNENTKDSLIVYRNSTNTFNIKFNKIYKPSREIYGMYLTDVVLNYENYISNAQKKEKIVLEIK